MAEKHRKCRVLYSGEHLATIYYFPDGTWTVEQQDIHVPIELTHVAHLFQSYVGRNPPLLVTSRLMDPRRPDFQDALKRNGLTADDYIGQLIAFGGRATDSIRFVP